MIKLKLGRRLFYSIPNKDKMDSFYISLLMQLCSMLDQVVIEIPTSLPFPKEGDPVSFHTPKAMQILCKANEYISNELEKLLLKSDEEAKRLKDYVTILMSLNEDFQELETSLSEALQFCSYREPICYHTTIAEFRAYIPSLATKIRNKIRAFIDPIIATEHEALKKEYGQPMAIHITPYPPPPPLPEETLKMLRNMLVYSNKDKPEALCLRFASPTPTTAETTT